MNVRVIMNARVMMMNVREMMMNARVMILECTQAGWRFGRRAILSGPLFSVPFR